MRTLTISIVSHGHSELLPPLLDDIRQYAPESQIIVTLNIPEPELDPLRWPHIKFRQNVSPKGFGANHNAALKDAKTEWLAIVNPDIRLTATTFPGLLKAMAGARRTAMFAPLVVGPDGQPQDSARPLPTITRIGRRVATRLSGREPPVEPMSQAAWFAGMFLVVRHDAFAAVGGFDERFFMYGEDVALSVQLVRQGYRIQAAKGATVIHDARRATLRSFRHLRWHVGSLLRLWRWPSFYRHESRLAALERQEYQR